MSMWCICILVFTSMIRQTFCYVLVAQFANHSSKTISLKISKNCLKESRTFRQSKNGRSIWPRAGLRAESKGLPKEGRRLGGLRSLETLEVWPQVCREGRTLRWKWGNKTVKKVSPPMIIIKLSQSVVIAFLPFANYEFQVPIKCNIFWQC